MTRTFSTPSWRSGLLALSLILIPATAAHAQRGSSAVTRDNKAVLDAFKAVVAKPSESTVRIQCDGSDAALGTVLSADGYIITKATLLKGKITCKTRDDKSYPAKVVGVEDKYDLAMLKIQATGLKPIEWRSGQGAEVGDWLASPGTGERPVAIGVLSVGVRKPSPREAPRVPPANSGYLGIGLDEGRDGGPVIGMVEKGSAADKAGLKVGDVVLSVAGKKVTSPDQLVAAIQSFKANQEVNLKIKRGDEEKDLKATLGKRSAAGPNRGDRMNSMGSKLSDRRTGFPVILQHDQVIKPEDCGGPLVDLDGKAVGINIARAGRTESYAIPAEAVLGLVSDLKSGKLAPKDEGAAALLAKIEAELTDALSKAKEELAVAEKDLAAAKDDEAKKKEAEKRVTEAKKKVAEAQQALDKAKKDRTKK